MKREFNSIIYTIDFNDREYYCKTSTSHLDEFIILKYSVIFNHMLQNFNKKAFMNSLTMDFYGTIYEILETKYEMNETMINSKYTSFKNFINGLFDATKILVNGEEILALEFINNELNVEAEPLIIFNIFNFFVLALLLSNSHQLVKDKQIKGMATPKDGNGLYLCFADISIQSILDLNKKKKKPSRKSRSTITSIE